MTLTNLTFIENERKMPLMMMPLRTTIIQLNAARVLFAPGSTCSEAQLRAAGDITDVIAPNLWHSTGVPKAHSVFPSARYWGPEGIREKRPGISWSIFGVDQWPFAGELELIALAGLPSINEHVFYHVASHSLICADLVFNMQNAHGFGARLILGLAGTYRRFAVSRLFMMTVKDRRAFAASLAELAAKQIDNIVPVHGDVVSASASTRLRSALHERGVAV